MSRGVSSKGSVPSDYEFSMYHVYYTTLKWIEEAWSLKVKLRDLLISPMIVLIIYPNSFEAFVCRMPCRYGPVNRYSA